MRSAPFALGLVLALPAAPGLAQSPEPTPALTISPSPVSIAACTIARRERTRGFQGNPYPLPITGGLRITFVNHGTAAVAEVAFRVDYRGESEIVHDVGTFTSGVAIAHSYDNFSDYAYLGPTPNVCRVAYVRLADGTTWGTPQRRRPAL